MAQDLDRLLEPYGSVGAVERRDQPSHRFLEDELKQQKVMSVTVPFIFFGVAAFLLNIALGRLVLAQPDRNAQGVRLFDPPDRDALPQARHGHCHDRIDHGVGGGILFGHAMIASYHGFFRFPSLDFELTPWSILAGTPSAWPRHRSES